MDVGLKGQKEISFKKVLHTSELKSQICPGNYLELFFMA
jgi:hypothetical protein